MEYKVTFEEINRIDKYLIDKLDLSRSKVQEMIKQDLVLVNERVVKNSYILKLNDVIEVIGELKKEDSVNPEKMDLDIIYEDEDVIVINKPSGLVVHPAAGN